MHARRTRSAAPAQELKQQVTETERAFAKTMADRDHAAFATFLADEAVFFAGQTPQRGKQQIADAWKRFYEKPAAPFSWQPETVEVLESGTSRSLRARCMTRPERSIGTFTSIWRLESPGKWRIVFDKGCEVCEACAAK